MCPSLSDIYNWNRGIEVGYERKALYKKSLELNLTYVVLDDDPTGTQTMHGVPVLTVWNVTDIASQFRDGGNVFFILTNSRGLTQIEAVDVALKIGKNIKKASEITGREFRIISRGDSTLRGHYPAEVDAIEESLEAKGNLKIIVPAFFEGGRYTFDNVHYMKGEIDLVPVGESAFAKDHTFGYRSSNLCDWVEEKTMGKISSESIETFSVHDLRSSGVSGVSRRLSSLVDGATVIVNALHYYDLDVFALGLLESGRGFTARSSASFVTSITGTHPISLLESKQIVSKDGNGGLFVVGSYVPKSTKQLEHLFRHSDIAGVVICIDDVLSDRREAYLTEILMRTQKKLNADEDVVLYTERRLIDRHKEVSPLEIGNEVSEFITEVVSQIAKPRFIVGKGGITSSDIATQSLRIKEARVLGQVLPGIPVWRAGKGSLFPGLPYIIFPGNVGEDSSLFDLYEKLKRE